MSLDFQKLSFRATAILVAFAIIAVCAIGATLYVSWKLQGSAAAINDLGSERMRSFRIAYLLSEASRAPAERTADARKVKVVAAEFERVLEGIERGDPARPLFFPETESLRSQLTTIRREWKAEIKPAIERALAADDLQVRARRLDEFRPKIDTFVGRIDRLVRGVELHSSRRTSLLFTLQLVLLGCAVASTVSLVYLLFLFVVRPVSALREGIRRMEDGDFTARVPVESRDELGELGEGFNRMAGHLQELYVTLEERVRDKTQTLEEKNRELATLYEVSTFLNDASGTADLCRGFLKKLMGVFAADAGSVRLVETGTDKVYLYVQEGLDTKFVKEAWCMRTVECLCGKTARDGETMVRVFGAELSEDSPYRCERAGFRTVAAFAIRIHKHVLGLFNLHFRHELEFSPAQCKMLETLGEHLGIAIENQRLVSRERELAVSQERNLLAQELHDSIAQSLAFLNLQAQMLEQSLKRGDLQESAEELARLREGIQESYDDVRELLVHFRLSPEREDMEQALRATLEKFEGQTGIRSRFNASGTGLALAPEDQLQVLHIVQEALSNVRKHSGATEVVVDMERGQEYQFRVSDNGCGFDFGSAMGKAHSHVGLTIMRERAHRIGGRLEVISSPGDGTRVTLKVPVMQREAA
ncbi:MAG: type IV pili methyl-accepting chemotaxis transducer N-terminal domain-containing protein [Betaproteobacteria bacterium]|nr:type IV pili methyl-accepting chemotaxis transducer N-terminal domain-containing protein [Betaproteobacteria bacterium]